MSSTAEVENAMVEQQPTEAPTAEESEKQEAEEKTKAPKPKTASHPPYFEMIREALLGLNEKSGSSPYAIAKYMEEKHKAVLPANFRKTLGRQLKNSAARGKLIKIKASYKLSEAAGKKPAKKQPTHKPGKRERMKQSAKADVCSSREAAEEEAVAEKEERPYVCPLGKNKNEKRSPEEEEAVMDDLFGYGFGMDFGRSEQEEEPEKEQEKEKEKEQEQEKGKEKKTAYHARRDYMTMNDKIRESWKKYARQVRESQGFDFVDFPGCSLVSHPPIVPFLDIRDKMLTDLSKKALAKFNSLNGSHYQFVEVVKANKRANTAFVLFITFRARKPRTDSLVAFQTRGYQSPNGKQSSIDFCRLKKGS